MTKDSKDQKSYHHGDLRRAILDAAEADLTESGLAGFSLRRVAARVGVSHTAPSHHFGDAAGLIDALALRGFERLLACMQARQDSAGPEAMARLMASGFGYLDFAVAHPALFRLVFGLPKGQAPSPQVAAAGQAAFQHLARDVAAVRGAEPMAHPSARAEVLACWTRVHGMAELILSGHVCLPDASDPQAHQTAREALFREVFAVSFATA